MLSSDLLDRDRRHHTRMYGAEIRERPNFIEREAERAGRLDPTAVDPAVACREAGTRSGRGAARERRTAGWRRACRDGVIDRVLIRPRHRRALSDLDRGWVEREALDADSDRLR